MYIKSLAKITITSPSKGVHIVTVDDDSPKKTVSSIVNAAYHRLLITLETRLVVITNIGLVKGKPHLVIYKDGMRVNQYITEDDLFLYML